MSATGTKAAILNKSPDFILQNLKHSCFAKSGQKAFLGVCMVMVHLPCLKNYSSLLLIFQIRVHMHEYISPEDKAFGQNITNSLLISSW